MFTLLPAEVVRGFSGRASLIKLSRRSRHILAQCPHGSFLGALVLVGGYGGRLPLRMSASSCEVKQPQMRQLQNKLFIYSPPTWSLLNCSSSLSSSNSMYLPYLAFFFESHCRGTSSPRGQCSTTSNKGTPITVVKLKTPPKSVSSPAQATHCQAGPDWEGSYNFLCPQLT